MFPPRAESVDSFSLQPAIGQPESGKLTSESRKPAEGLSRRTMLGAMAALPAAPAAALAIDLTAPDGFERVVDDQGRTWFKAVDDTPDPAFAPDAELIDLGARLEPLVDQYYAARERWALSLMAAHAERDRKSGDLPEFSTERMAAITECCERSGEPEAGAALSAVHEEMEPLMKAINAAPVNSIAGLRAKALVALREVAPLCASDVEFSFEDAYPFQQLFTAVAELCGLKDKMAATGYALPDINTFVAAPDDDSDDDGEDA